MALLQEKVAKMNEVIFVRCDNGKSLRVLRSEVLKGCRSLRGVQLNMRKQLTWREIWSTGIVREPKKSRLPLWDFMLPEVNDWYCAMMGKETQDIADEEPEAEEG